MIMCLQIWMQLLIGFGLIVEDLKVISKEEEKKISTCKMLFLSTYFFSESSVTWLCKPLFDSKLIKPQIIYL